MLKNVSISMEKGNPIIINKNEVDIGNEKPIENPDVGVNSKIVESLMSVKHKYIKGNSVSRSVRIFTRDMETIETLATIEQQKELC